MESLVEFFVEDANSNTYDTIVISSPPKKKRKSGKASKAKKLQSIARDSTNAPCDQSVIIIEDSKPSPSAKPKAIDDSVIIIDDEVENLSPVKGRHSENCVNFHLFNKTLFFSIKVYAGRRPSHHLHMQQNKTPQEETKTFEQKYHRTTKTEYRQERSVRICPGKQATFKQDEES